MGDRDGRNGDEGGDDGGRERGGRGRGPEGTEFLDLEMSKVMYGEATELAREAGRELLKEIMKARIKERFGDKLAALGRIAADQLVDDLEANLAIEGQIAARREARGSVERAVADALRPRGSGAARDDGGGRGSRDRGDERGSKSPAPPRRSRSSR